MLSLWHSARCTSHQALLIHKSLCGFNSHSSPEVFFFFSEKNLGTCIQVLQQWFMDELGLMASASSRVPQWQHGHCQGCSIRESYFWSNGHQELALVYPFSPPPCSQGLGSSIGRASHRKCEGVGSIPTQVLRFFSLKKNLGTCIQVLQQCSSLLLITSSKLPSLLLVLLITSNKLLVYF